jgi:hypothetical protein
VSWRQPALSTELLTKGAVAIFGLGVAGYVLLSMYSQPISTYREIEPVRTFLNLALAHDSASLVSQAGTQQPVQWALAAVKLDSAAVREWAVSRPRVTSNRNADTLWVTLRRPGSTERCSPLYPLTAGFLEDGGDLQLIHLSSLCPSVFRTAQ